MRSQLILAVAVFSTASLPALADNISEFTITGQAVTFGLANDYNTLTGTATIDTTTGVVQDLSYTAGGITEAGVDAQYGANVFVGADAVNFTFTGTTLIDFAGGTFNVRDPVDDYVGQVQFSMMSPADPTPEPSSLLLLGTGMLGVVGTLRRRMRSSA